jgi:hypothetical protein
VSGNWTLRSPTCTAGGVSRSVATLAALEAECSVGVGLTTVDATGVTTERRFDELLPKLLMRLKKRLVRLPLFSSAETMDAAPERTSSLAGTGPGVEAFERPKDLRRRECKERWSGDGGLAGIDGIGGRKA